MYTNANLFYDKKKKRTSAYLRPSLPFYAMKKRSTPLVNNGMAAIPKSLDYVKNVDKNYVHQFI